MSDNSDKVRIINPTTDQFKFVSKLVAADSKALRKQGWVIAEIVPTDSVDMFALRTALPQKNSEKEIKAESSENGHMIPSESIHWMKAKSAINHMDDIEAINAFAKNDKRAPIVKAVSERIKTLS